jgi:hypothetical protein
MQKKALKEIQGFSSHSFSTSPVTLIKNKVRNNVEFI